MARIDPNGVQAGEYELLDGFWDRPTSKPGDPGHPTYERVYEGEVVELDQAEAQRLTRSGSVAPKGAREKARANFAAAQFVAELNQLSPEVRAEVLSKLGKDAPEGVLDPAQGGVVVQDAPGFVAPDNPVVAVRANAQGDGGPDPQSGDEPEAVQEQTPSVADAVPEAQAERAHHRSEGRSGGTSRRGS